MTLQAFDPLGHIRIAVSDLEISHLFYASVFKRLRFRQVSPKGWVSPEGLGIWIIQAAHPEHRYVFEAPGLHHLCLKVPSKEHVDELYRFLQTDGTTIVVSPQAYPQYTPDYYAVFFSDPDGMELEVAHYS